MSKRETHTQFAALPYRVTSNGRPEVLLLTSRETRRWVIPKGWPMPDRTGAEVAERETFEEAGVVGKIVGRKPIGSYFYAKALSPRDDLLCQVFVFLLRADRQLEDWPERLERRLRWCTPQEAAGLVVEGSLAELIRATF